MKRDETYCDVLPIMKIWFYVPKCVSPSKTDKTGLLLLNGQGVPVGGLALGI